MVSGMTNYLINEVAPGLPTGPSSNVSIEAAKYEEKGSFTVFVDDAGDEVFAMQTEKIRTIRVVK